MKMKLYNQNDMPDSREMARADKQKVKGTKKDGHFLLRQGTALFSCSSEEQRDNLIETIRYQTFDRFGKKGLEELILTKE